MPFCEWCDQPVKIQWAVKLSTTNWRSSGLYFCTDDHKEKYREYHDPSVERCRAARRTPLGQMHEESDGMDYGEWYGE
jgi:hypothetical protein